MAVKEMMGEDFGFWHEYFWPIFSSVFFVRPLHFAATRYIAGIQKGDKVLELGSGYPWYELYAGKVGNEGLFIALDGNLNIQKRSKAISAFIDKKVRHKEEPTVDQIVASVRKLPFLDNSFDKVLVSNAPHIAGEVNRVLKPGGKALVAMTNPILLPVITALDFLAYKRADFVNVKMFPGTPAFISPSHPYVAVANWYVSARKPD